MEIGVNIRTERNGSRSNNNRKLSGRYAVFVKDYCSVTIKAFLGEWFFGGPSSSLIMAIIYRNDNRHKSYSSAGRAIFVSSLCLFYTYREFVNRWYCVDVYQILVISKLEHHFSCHGFSVIPFDAKRVYVEFGSCTFNACQSSHLHTCPLVLC